MEEILFSFVLNKINTMKLKNETFSQWYDENSGEYKAQTTSKTYTIKVQQDSFFMTYFKYMSSFYDLTSPKEIFLITMFCEKAEFDTGIVTLYPELRNELMTILKIEKTYLSTCIKNLCSKDILKKLSTNRYLINPKMFWKGNNRSRNELLKTGNININIEFEKEEQ